MKDGLLGPLDKPPPDHRPVSEDQLSPLGPQNSPCLTSCMSGQLGPVAEPPFHHCEEILVSGTEPSSWVLDKELLCPFSLAATMWSEEAEPRASPSRGPP